MATTKENLRDQGIITLCGKINTETIIKVVENIVLMNNIQNPEFDAIQLILNSTGGSIYAGFELIDIMEYSRLPVYVTGLGCCASMGHMILCAGKKGHRVVTKNTTLLSHQFSWSSDGKYHELVADRKQQSIFHRRLVNHYLKHTKLNKKQVESILLPKSDVWMTPQEAKKYGIVDKVIG